MGKTRPAIIEAKAKAYDFVMKRIKTIIIENGSFKNTTSWWTVLTIGSDYNKLWEKAKKCKDFPGTVDFRLVDFDNLKKIIVERYLKKGEKKNG